jgi:hypothetical protein
MVTLVDGTQRCNYCPDYKDECLARHVLALSTKEERREFLAAWSKRHGTEAGNALADLVRSVWEARRRERS